LDVALDEHAGEVFADFGLELFAEGDVGSEEFCAEFGGGFL
jgi:hypothetical protein